MIQTTSLPLSIIIVGGGIGGLAAATFLSRGGHNVTVLDANSSLSEIGAGIQVAPNAMRIFDRYGLKDKFYEEATKQEGAIIRRWDNGKVLGKIGGMLVELYGYFNCTLHRADYQRILYDAAVKAGANIKFGKRVIDIDVEAPFVILEDGTKLASDLVIAADGIGSRIPYTIRGTDLYNVVFCGPETSSSKIGAWNEPASLPELKKAHEGWDNTIHDLLDRAGTIHKWRIGDVPDLPSWRSKSGRVLLLGDAAHAMMPYSAQGATASVEDAAVLSGCLGRVKKREEISKLTEDYERIRKWRVEKVKSTSWGNMKQYGLVDGEEQEERDRLYAKALVEQMGGEEKKVEPPKKDANAKYGSPGFFMWLYGYDVEEELEKYFGESKGSNEGVPSV